MLTKHQIMYLRIPFFILFICVFLSPSFSQYRPVQTGSRPPVDLETVSPESVEPGWFRVRLTRNAGDILEQQPVRTLEGHVLFGMEAIDMLSQTVGLRDAQPTFSGPAMRARYSERHRLWGFHLWYDLYIDSERDILETVAMFAALDEVDIAEPVYRKELIAGDPIDRIPARVDLDDAHDEWFPDDPQFSSQWHYHNTGQSNGTPGADIRLPAAWAIETGNPDVKVAIIDDGIQFTHPDLEANMWEDIGYNFVNDSPNINPGDHGTHVAGTVAAVTNNGVGVSGIAGGSGTGDGVRLMSAQVFSGLSSGGFPNAFVWAADNGAAIAQNSWGYTSAGVVEQVVLDAIDYFNVNGGGDVLEGGITIFAAGNSNASGEWYPGFYEGSFSVAATNHSDQKAAYSNYGNWIDISAPGGETTTSNNRGVLSTVTGSSYAYYQGTSMACPHVSGAAALVLSYAPGVMTSSELWDLLAATADDHYAANPNFPGQLGSGRLNAHQALLEAGDFLDGLINPSSFSAVAQSSDAISLSWNANPNNDPVLLAYSEDGSFGQPEGTYAPGQMIPGGGQVLLSGQHTGFVHEELEAATSYYYRIWSMQDGSYSSGRNAGTETLCGIFLPPFTENFPGQQLPLCWEASASSGSNWQIGTISNGLNIDGFYAYSGTGLSFGSQDADLISPVIDMSGHEEVTVSFKHYFRTGFLAGGTGTFSYSLDNGSSWTTVDSWTNTTSNPATFEAVIPELAGEPMVAFRWNMSYGFSAYYWTMGDLSVTGTPLEQEDLFTVTFDIVREDGHPVADAFVVLDGIANEAGEYLFKDLEPGTYSYVVTHYCYPDEEGSITVAGEDVNEAVTLQMIPGDANGDGVVDILDVLAVSQYFNNESPAVFCFDNADINGDGIIDILDILGIVTLFSGK